MKSFSPELFNSSSSTLEKSIESKIRKALYTFQMNPKGHLAIALSGGKDSLTLLYFLHKIRGHGFENCKISALYVDGAYSCGPGQTKKFLEEFTSALDIDLHVLSSTSNARLPTCYSCSRIRRKILFEKMTELNIDTIAFGHHKDDVIETLLMNFFHKGEFAGMEPNIYFYHYNIRLIRPLYYVEEKEILQFGQQKNFLRFTCMCPVGMHSKRKETKQLVQLIQTKFPHVKANIFHALTEHGKRKALDPPKKIRSEISDV